ncbi:MAG: hypothetical protein H8F28_08670, partial [Fibrella sp.]|nr:hypothetical protein [Armatimonadota bacterium]
MKCRSVYPVLFCLLVLLGGVGRASAQLTQSFYNITGIETKVLPNAVRITIQTDGDVKLGVDFKEYLDVVGDNFEDNIQVNGMNARRSFRLRFAGARQKIPAFTEIAAYPVDSAVVRLSREPLVFPFFENGDDPTQDGSGTPGVDLEIRFYVPIQVSYFTFRFDDYYGWNFSYPVVLKPGEASIVVAPDNRSVVITVITDRVEQYRNPDRIRRSPADKWNHSLRVTGDEKQIKVEALHATLAETLTEIARVSGLSLQAQPDAAEADVNVFLPARSAEDNLRTLTSGLGLTLTARLPEQGGGFLVGRFGTSLSSERLPLVNLSADAARLLFPDFLLPYLRVDTELNALIATGSPALLARLKKDTALLDRAPVQVRVEAQAYELSYPEEDAYILRGTINDGRVGFDSDAGQVTVALQSDQKESLEVRLNALIAKGRARLVARPHLTVMSGKRGTLFFGQTRFISILTNNYGGQTAEVIPLPVGTTLTVTPTTAGGDTDILLDLRPRFSTVDA